MSSRFLCPCGNRINTNLFSGEKASLVITDDFLDQISDAFSKEDVIREIVLQSKTLVTCSACKRLFIQEAQSGNITTYRKEIS